MTKPKPIKAIIITADFHKDISRFMVKTAQQELANNHAEVLGTIHVPGSYEIPLVAQTVLKKYKPDILVTLGYIEKGHTLHGEVMGHVIMNQLVSLQLKYQTPIGLGIIGPGATLTQARQRQKPVATAAVKAALAVFKTQHNSGIIKK